MPPTDIPARVPISNETWDAAAMLAKAERGAYPAAKSRRPSREMPGLTEAEAEVAYWRARAGGVALDEATARDIAARQQQEAALRDERGGSEPAHEADDLDARFLALRPMQQRGLTHSYLTSTQAVDHARAAHLCALTGRDVATERAAAEAAWQRMAEQCAARLRASAERRRGGTLWVE
jgi:hypothetical protein